MAVQKNFVVKNGIEVNDNLIFADKDKNTVGIGTTITPEKLQVNGGIGATSLVLSGIGTIPTLKSTTGTINNLYSVSGVVTSISGTGLTYTTGNFAIANATNVNVVSGIVTNLAGTISTYTDAYSTTSHTTTLNATNAYVTTGVVTSITGAQLNYTDATITDLTSTRINNSGIATVGSLSIGSTQVLSSAQQLQNILSLDATTTATIGAAITTAPLTFANILVAGISTLGTVKVASGIVTATSGVVTYYGDGRYLDLTANPSRGIGIGTTGGVVGYGITFLDLKGAGVSTSIYNSSVGIATIFFQGGGGGGGGAIGIGSTFPGTPLSILSAPSNGDLFYHIDYGRTFIYYDEVILGVGSSAFWVDAAPFNVGVNPTLAGVAFSMGTANNPSAYFEGYTNTGWFSPTAGQFGIVSVGNTILTANPSGIVVTGIASATTFSGNFSGGTAVFADTTSGDLVRITQTGTGNALIVEDQTNPDASPFVITGIGSVGIQTNAPSANFDVFGGMKISRQDTAFDGGEITFARASDNVNAWSLDVYGSNANTSFRITDVINSQPRIHIGSGGNVGIGSTATSKLHVFGDAYITGIATFGTSSVTIDGNTNNVRVGSAVTINTTGINVAGVVTATSFKGDGSQLTGLGGGGASITVLTTNTTLSKGNVYMLNTSGLVLTLPASPSTGDAIDILNNVSGIHTLARNGSTIMSLSEDMTFGEAGLKFKVWYTGSTWSLF